MAVSQKEADAYDRIIDAAAELAELIEHSGIGIAEYDLEELTIYLAHNALRLKEILGLTKQKAVGSVKRAKPASV